MLIIFGSIYLKKSILQYIIITLSISFADTASSKEKNYTIEETITESETEIESGSDENVPLKPLSDIAPNKH